LTQYWDGKLIAVIVSGYDGDWAAALCGIREVGGITIAQKIEIAKHPDMPGSAIKRATTSGCVDCVLSPGEIAQNYSDRRRSDSRRSGTVRQAIRILGSALARVVDLIR
jgi:two-component system chemotaxis response regulator CheB